MRSVLRMTKKLGGVDKDILLDIGGKQGLRHPPGTPGQRGLGQLAGLFHQGGLHRVGQLKIGVGRKLGGVVRVLQCPLYLPAVHGGRQLHRGEAPAGLAAVRVLHIPEHGDLILAHVLAAPGVQLLLHEEQLGGLLRPLVDPPQGDAAAGQGVF